MRTALILVALMAVAFAGCVTEEPEEPELPETPAPAPTNTPPVVETHPDYGFVTMNDLEEGTIDDFPMPELYNGTNPPGSPYYWKKPAFHDFGLLPKSIDFQTATGGVQGGGHGIAVFGPLAIAGGNSGPMNIINILDPNNPTVVSRIDSPVRDVDFIMYPDGRLVVVSTSGGGTMVFTDVTDPHNPEQISVLSTSSGNHNLVAVPGSPIVYSSASGGSTTSIVDASDPNNPFEVKNWNNGYGCHDAAFMMNATLGKFRGYCAGLDKVQIWDVSNATNPTVISEWGWPAGGIHDAGAVSIVTFAHLAIPNHDGTILILGDETGGGVAPGCDFSAHEPTTGTTVTGPLGNLWFYDITDEANPILKGSVSPSATDQRGSCTAHFGRVIEQTNHVVMGFYSAGVLLVDFRDPQNPVIVDRYEQPMPVAGEGEGPGSIWDVWYYQGYLFTGDMNKGVDVLTVNGS